MVAAIVVLVWRARHAREQRNHTDSAQAIVVNQQSNRAATVQTSNRMATVQNPVFERSNEETVARPLDGEYASIDELTTYATAPPPGGAQSGSQSAYSLANRTNASTGLNALRPVGF